MDNSNTTTVYYEKSTGKHQNKSTSIQTSPRHPESIGTTTATQTTNEKAPQGSGTQTMLPPSPKKSTSTGGTQTSPPKNPHRQVDQGQLDHNEESQPANTTSSKGKKTKKSTSKAPPPPGLSTGPAVGPRNDHIQKFRYWQAHNPVYSMW